MLIAGLIIGSGVLLSASKLRKNKETLPSPSSITTQNTQLESQDSHTTANSFVWADKHFKIANVSLACTVAGTLLPPLTLIGMGGLVYLTYPTWVRAYYDLTKKRRFTRIVVESMVLPGAILSGHYIAAATTYWFLYFALRMVAKTKENTAIALADTLETQSPVVYVVVDDVEVETSLVSLKQNDVIRAKQGERLYVQGEVLEGDLKLESHLDKVWQKGDFIELASMPKIVSGTALVRVKQVSQAVLDKKQESINLDNAESSELLSVDFVDRLALPHFLLGTVTGSLKGARSGLAILWLPFDDALYTAGPLSVLNYLNISLDKGILIKDGHTLEGFSRIHIWGITAESLPEDIKTQTMTFKALKAFQMSHCYINDPNRCLNEQTIALLNQYDIQIYHLTESEFVDKLQQKDSKVAYITHTRVSAECQHPNIVSISLADKKVLENHASIFFMKQHLSQLPELLELATKLKKNYHRTLAASLVPSTMIIGGVFAFHMTLASSVFLYIAGMGLSLGNAMLPKLTEKT